MVSSYNIPVGFISVIFFIGIFYTSVLAIDNVGQSHFNPSVNFLNVLGFDGNSLTRDNLKKTFYHLQKSSLVFPPIKKVTSLMEKKVPSQSAPSTTESSLEVETVPLDAKFKTENSTLSLNSAEFVESSTEEVTNSANGKYNISVTSPVVVTNETVSSTAGSMSTSVTSTTSPLTTFPEMTSIDRSSITHVMIDHHIFYNYTMYTEDKLAMAYWVNFDEIPQDKVVVHQILSDSHRMAATVSLSFDFPFYGHPLRKIAIATGGFIYMGDYLHSWLAATQYIAPFMANFDTSLSNRSTIRYFDNGTALVIEWHAVTLQAEKIGGNFSFQAILSKNGDIVFVYKIIPVPVREIKNRNRPVKVGLSDSYVMDRTMFIRRKTIYEYGRIIMKKVEIGNQTAIYFTALATCMNFRDCNSCMASYRSGCVWCKAAKRCSDGFDKIGHNWGLQSKCNVEAHQFKKGRRKWDRKGFWENSVKVC